MKSLSIREMRNSLGQLGSLVEESGELVVTRRGRPIARVLPVTPAKAKPSHADLRQKMPRLAIPSEVLVDADRGER